MPAWLRAETIVFEPGAALSEKIAVVGSGAIACGVAAVAAAKLGEAVLIARSEQSATRARMRTGKLLARLDSDAEVTIGTSQKALTGATVVVEAVAEDFSCKAEVLADVARHADADAILGTTTSSLSIEQLGRAIGHADRFIGLHVFNPVPRMKLIEVIYTQTTTDTVRGRTRALWGALGKTGVEVPDIAGFVVNRLLFPMLFDAVRLVEQHGVDPADVDCCMTLGAGHPMGPLALLDYVGIDVSIAIGESIGADVPERLRELERAGHLGKKTGCGFFAYDRARSAAALTDRRPAPVAAATSAAEGATSRPRGGA